MKLTQRIAKLDWPLLLIGLCLISCGLIAIGRAVELELCGRQQFERQAVWAALSLVVMLMMTLFNYRRLGRISYALFFVSLILLVVVYFFPKVNGAHRWIRIGPIGFQPSELAKLTFILALSHYLMYRDNYRSLRGLVIPLAIVMLPVLLILREPDLGTALVFLPILFAMLYTAGARVRDLAWIGLIALATTPLFWSQMSREQKSRVTALWQQNAPDEKPTDDGYHLHQAKQLIAQGGIWGSYFAGEVDQEVTDYFVPEAHSDSIITVWSERFGVVGFGFLLLIYLLLIWRIMAIASKTREPLGQLIAVGIATMIATAVVINTGMMVGLLPITGLSLPLVSYGGTGLLAQGIALGLLMNINMRPGYEVANDPFEH